MVDTKSAMEEYDEERGFKGIEPAGETRRGKHTQPFPLHVLHPVTQVPEHLCCLLVDLLL